MDTLPTDLFNTPALTAPFPYFGGKRRVAREVWKRLGDVAAYVEPFMGSGATLLARPHKPRIETVCDIDHHICNVWRAIQAEPEAVARWADWPVNECDLAVRHAWLVTEGRARIAACATDLAHYDAQVAGWWLWGACAWIGTGWCSGKGPWSIKDGQWVKAGGDGVNRQTPAINGEATGMGINRSTTDAATWLHAIAVRLRRVRVVCGDWTRVTGNTVISGNGVSGVFLDPPYSVPNRSAVYRHDDYDVAKQAAEWARKIGQRPTVRVAFAGYDGEHDFPGWSVFRWKASGGYGSQGESVGRSNSSRETIWFSPACLND